MDVKFCSIALSTTTGELECRLSSRLREGLDTMSLASLLGQLNGTLEVARS